MKLAQLSLIVWSIVLLSAAVAADERLQAKEPAPPKGGQQAQADRGFALVELFTSQGCSSCPPADKVLAELDQWSRSNKRSLYCLSFHVDYWNYIGWEDPYGSKVNTARQRSYARRFGEKRVYTPQMVVNGNTGFVGSQRKRAATVIKSAMAQPARDKLTATVRQIDNGRLNVDYRRSGSDEATIYAALAQRTADNAVERGENSGRKLSHVAVVRSLASQQAAPTGKLEVQIPSGLRVTDCEIVLFLQEPGLRTILAATRLGVGGK